MKNVWVLVMSVIVISGAKTASEEYIQHPVWCYDKYKRCRHCPYDSVLVGKIIYDPIPEYQKESRMFIEYYCGFDSDRDVILRAGGEIWGYWLSEYKLIWPGPVHIGDTLRADLKIIPLKVGGVRPSFVVIEQSTYDFPDSTVDLEIVRAPLRAHFMLNPDGTVFGMNSRATNESYETFLGPFPEIMADSLVFVRDPKMPAELISQNGEPSRKFKYFAIEAIVYTQPDDSGYRHVRCRLSSYHNFDGGIKFRVSTGGAIEYKDKSTNHDDPVTANDILDFSFDFKITAPGLSRMTVGFRTLNPEKGIGSLESDIGHGDEKLSSWIDIYLGYDDDMRLLFITDKDPLGHLKGNTRAFDHYDQKRLEVQRQLDPRIEWLENIADKEP